MTPPRAGPAEAPARHAGGQGRRVLVAIETSPPGADVCLASDGRRLGASPRSIELPADGRRRALFVVLPGRKVEELVVRADEDQRRTVRLTRLGPDDLEDASPCR